MEKKIAVLAGDGIGGYDDIDYLISKKGKIEAFEKNQVIF